MFTIKLFNKLYKLTVNNVRKISFVDAYTNVELKNGIKTITMCHAKTRNALSIPMMETLLDNITKEQDDPSLRVIVITGKGPVFSAGHNLKELSSAHSKDQHQKVFSLASRLMCSMIDSPVPVIARVDGLAAAAGCQLVAQCDMAVCSTESTFSTPGANVGIFCSTPGIPLGRNVMRKMALQMLFTGLPISSQEALNAGLVNKVCSRDILDTELQSMCSAIIHKSRTVISKGKKFFNEQMQLDIKNAYAIGEKIMTEYTNSDHGREGINSFIEKRKPNWGSCS